MKDKSCDSITVVILDPRSEQTSSITQHCCGSKRLVVEYLDRLIEGMSKRVGVWLSSE